MTQGSKKKKLDPREIVRNLLDSEEVRMTPRAAALLLCLQVDGNPAGSSLKHEEFAAALGPLYRPSVLISWTGQNKLGQRLKWGQSKLGQPERTPEEKQKIRGRAVQRAEKELIALGILTVLSKAGPMQYRDNTPRPDLRTNLYALDLEACQRLTPEPEIEENEGSPVTPRYLIAENETKQNDPSRVTGRYENDPSPVTDKDQTLNTQDQVFLSQDQVQRTLQDQVRWPFEKNDSSETSKREKFRSVIRAGSDVIQTPEQEENLITKLLESGSTPEELEEYLRLIKENREELRAALRSTSTSRAKPKEEAELIKELESLEATPEQVEAAGPILKAKGWEHVTPRQIVQEWPYILEQFKLETEAPAVTSTGHSTQDSSRCSCGGPVWLQGPDGLVHCWRHHNIAGQPDLEKWAEYGLEAV